MPLEEIKPKIYIFVSSEFGESIDIKLQPHLIKAFTPKQAMFGVNNLLTQNNQVRGDIICIGEDMEEEVVKKLGLTMKLIQEEPKPKPQNPEHLAQYLRDTGKWIVYKKKTRPN